MVAGMENVISEYTPNLSMFIKIYGGFWVNFLKIVGMCKVGSVEIFKKNPYYARNCSTSRRNLKVVCHIRRLV